VRGLDHQPGTVAGIGIAAARPSVLQVHEYLDALVDHIVGLLSLDVRDEADSAGVVLLRRIVQALGLESAVLPDHRLPPRDRRIRRHRATRLAR
jgi:hypothetical protein